MKTLSKLCASVLLLGLAVLPTQASFTSLYIFGDGISTTTNNTTAQQFPQYFYGMRECNGRVWVEVLAQRLGLGANSITNANWSNATNDWSYFGQYSPNLVTNLNHFTPPQDAKTALFVVWVNNADFVSDMGNIYLAGYGTNNTKWNAAIAQSLNDHWSIITNLYTKGARTIVMPNAVDITEIPAYDNLQVNQPATRNFIRQEVISFNTQFAALLNQAQASLPGLTIYEPNYFSLLDNVLANSSAYGLTNALNSSGVSIDAYDDPNILKLTINGQGTNYIFWNATDPTAKLHEIMADTAVQMIAPVQISKLAVITSDITLPNTNRLDLINVPIGLNGFVLGTTNLAVSGSWTTVTNITSTSAAQSVYVYAPALPYVESGGNGSILMGGGSGGSQSSGPGAYNVGEARCYRLAFPFAWNWP